MKRTIKHKKLISLIAVLILLVSLSASSYAVWNPFDYQRNRAFVAAALTALNISFQSQQMAAQSVVEYIADPLEVNYTYIDAWQDRPEIQIWDDYVTIDGVEYTDIWISNEAAEKFRVDAWDFNTAYQIASQSNGTFASGVGSYDGVPIYNSNGSVKSQAYRADTSGNYEIGNGNLYIEPWNPGTGRVNYTTSNGVAYSNVVQNATFPIKSTINRSAAGWYINSVGANLASGNKSLNANLFDNTPFDYTWVSQEIPANLPLPSDTGMMIRVPSKDPLGNPYFVDFLTDNPEFKDQPVTIDVNLDPDIMNKLDDLINIVAPIIPMINTNRGDVNFTVNHTQPAPVIDNLLPDTYKQEILQPITENFYETQQTIQNMGDSIVENIPKIDEICNNIDTAPYHDLDTGLDHLPSVFLPFITDLRSALGIWHYVTEWISQISTTFAFITGCLVGTSIMTPIYAAIAGFMCIKVYRRMTG